MDISGEVSPVKEPKAIVILQWMWSREALPTYTLL